MNREILFRGKRCSDGKWVYGFYVESKYSWQGHKPHKSWIVPNAISNGGFFNVLGRYAVKDDTVGQFAGLVDKNGVKIFEGDWVLLEGVGIFNVRYSMSMCQFGLYGKRGFVDALKELQEDRYVVVGNVYDNPELLATK